MKAEKIKYSVEIELLSESILGSGESVPGFVDFDVLYDEIGIPYYKAKTLKGKLREEAENITRIFKDDFSNDELINLFGIANNNSMNKLSFSDACVNSLIKKLINNEFEHKKFNKIDILNAFTNIRRFTSIDDNGVAKEGSLREIRVINRGLILMAEINVLDELTKKEEELLALSVSSLKHLGLMSSRGKGNVKCSLYKSDKEITRECIKNFVKGGIY